MSQPDFAEVYSADQQSALDANDSDCLTSSGAVPSPAEVQALFAELAQVRSLEHEHLTRIHHLEQALDQALACLDDLRLRVQNQGILEAQLVKTEEFAGVQQQAIARLKQQLQRQQYALQVRDQLILAIAAIATSAMQALERRQTNQDHDPESTLPIRIMLALSALPQSSQTNDLEEQLKSAQQQIQTLSTQILQLETQLQQATANRVEQDVLELTLRQAKALAAERNSTIAALQQDLAIAQIKVEELETQLSKQSKAQAKWQQSCQELELEREQYQSRIAALEQEAEEMQEQILEQARQTGEYETAVQHWKDRYFSSHQEILQLNDLLKQALSRSPLDADEAPSLPPALLELLEALQLLVANHEQEPSQPSAMLSPRFNTLDLPDFLIRRRSHRAR